MLRRLVTVGRILGPFGVRGWVKVQSYTEPTENILKYSPWSIADPDGTREYRVLDGRRHGNVVIGLLEGMIEREQAMLLQGREIAVPRDRFAPPKRGEYYWVDLIGLDVRGAQGFAFGRITGMLQTGANDVMEVGGDRERLIPFVIGEFVKEVRIEEGFVVVDWDPDF